MWPKDQSKEQVAYLFGHGRTGIIIRCWVYDEELDRKQSSQLACHMMSIWSSKFSSSTTNLPPSLISTPLLSRTIGKKLFTKGIEPSDKHIVKGYFNARVEHDFQTCKVIGINGIGNFNDGDLLLFSKLPSSYKPHLPAEGPLQGHLATSML